MSPSDSQARTRMFARVVGPFLAVVTVAALVHPPDLSHVSVAGPNALWIWTAGAFTLLAGLVVIALHPFWRGAAAIILSTLGWLTAVKGFLLVAFPATLIAVGGTAGNPRSWWLGSYVVFAVVGAYLTYVGWAPVSSRGGRSRI